MTELERLAGELTEILGESGIYYEHKCVIEQAAAILLAASKVDVAGLMELVAKVSNAAYVAGLQDANGEGCDATAQTLFEDELETALRMALAQREWAGLTTEDTMTDQYKYLETPEEAFAALLEQNKGGPVVEWLEDCQWSRVITPEAWKVVDVCQLKFRVPLPPVVTVVYHVHEKISGCHLYERYTEEEAWDVVGEFCYIVKHTVTNGVPAVEVVK